MIFMVGTIMWGIVLHQIIKPFKSLTQTED